MKQITKHTKEFSNNILYGSHQLKQLGDQKKQPQAVMTRRHASVDSEKLMQNLQVSPSTLNASQWAHPLFYVWPLLRWTSIHIRPLQGQVNLY